MPPVAGPPADFFLRCRQHGVAPTQFVFAASVATQSASLFEQTKNDGAAEKPPRYELCRTYVISTSRFGIGQVANSNCTPLGLHRIAQKIGGGQPVGTVFKSREPIGFTWDGMPDAKIAHRILWLEGLEPGFNRGGDVDTFDRYVYIHGVGDESTLGKPASCGCIHLAAADLIPFYDQVPEGTLVWIEK